MITEMRILAAIIIVAMILTAAAFICFPLLVKYGYLRMYGPSLREKDTELALTIDDVLAI